jgi:hypothetical protein
MKELTLNLVTIVLVLFTAFYAVGHTDVIFDSNLFTLSY